MNHKKFLNKWIYWSVISVSLCCAPNLFGAENKSNALNNNEQKSDYKRIKKIHRERTTPLFDVFDHVNMSNTFRQPCFNEVESTPLHTASLINDVKGTKALLDTNEGVNLINQKSETALHLASSVKNTKALLEAGADVNAVDRYKQTPLHSAAKAGYAKIVKALLDAGADVNALDKDGKTAPDLANETNKITCTDLFSRECIAHKKHGK